MREIALDTETTGLDPAKGHRVVEIGAVEIAMPLVRCSHGPRAATTVPEAVQRGG